MYSEPTENNSPYDITVSEEVRRYILDKGHDFRVCTSCGGPIILSTLVKPAKPTDIEIYIGKYILYVSIYQARFISCVSKDMIPQFTDYSYTA
ncbi:MAG: hypothetical protein II893_07595 [Methanomicrobium sp.]|jgi:hypothetical protein|nr:hypothetical protein [Methanomicrobium sp.]MBQ3719235.1 hypothetical protein [Methanomicrobium sp.]